MDSKEFRDQLQRVGAWMADYYDRRRELPVRSPVEPDELLNRLPADPPERGEEFERIWRDFESLIVPGMTHWQHPRFFAYFPANTSPPSILAETAAAALGAQCMSWETSPAATELEIRVLEWLRTALGLPASFTGSIQDTASTATLTAMVVARERATEEVGTESGLSGGPPLSAYCSVEAHSSVDKAIAIAGIGRTNLRKIPVDESFAMRPEALDAAISEDRARGYRPVAVTACLGTTGASGFDPLDVIGRVCRAHGVWLHVDAAWAGSACVAPEFRWMLDGVEAADSFVFNPHKWLLTNFDCSVLFVRDPDALVRTMGANPEYLKTRHTSVVNFRDWGIPLGRRFRALKLWFVLRTYGLEGIRAHIRRHVRLAHELAGWIGGDPAFTLVRAPVLSLLCFRYTPPGVPARRLDTLNEELLHRLNDRGRIYLTHTRIADAFVMRFAIGQTDTGPEDVAEAWDEIRRVASGLTV